MEIVVEQIQTFNVNLFDSDCPHIQLNRFKNVSIGSECLQNSSSNPVVQAHNPASLSWSQVGPNIY